MSDTNKINYTETNLQWDNLGTAPTSQQKADGFVPGDKLPASTENYLRNQIYDFVQDVIDSVNENADILQNTGVYNVLDYTEDTIYDGTTSASSAITSTLSAMNTNGTGGVLYFPNKGASTYLLSSNLDLTSYPNITLKFASGAKIDLDTYTITGNDTRINAEHKQIFDVSDTGDFAGTFICDETIPDWFGCVGDDSTDNIIPLQKALDFSILATNTCKVYPGTYRISSQLKVPNGLRLIGNKEFGTIIKLTTAGTCIGRDLSDFPISSAFTRINIKNMTFMVTVNNSHCLDVSGFNFSNFENISLTMYGTTTGCKGLYGVSPEGLSSYYNKYTNIDVYGDVANKTTNKCCGYFIGNDRSAATATEQKRSPNSNLFIGGRIQGCQQAIYDVSGVGNVYINQILESNYHGFRFGTPLTDNTDMWGVSDGYSITWTEQGSNAKVLYPYMEQNTGNVVHFDESADGTEVRVGYSTAGTPVQNDSNYDVTYIIPNEEAVSTPSSIVGGSQYFKRKNYYATGSKCLGSSATRFVTELDETPGSGKLISFQNYSPSDLGKTFRINNATDAVDMLNVSNLGNVRAGNGVSGGAYTTTERNALTGLQTGTMVWDSTLSKPVWYNGSSWEDATGASV